jgi:hypothetical protein
VGALILAALAAVPLLYAVLHLSATRPSAMPPEAPGALGGVLVADFEIDGVDSIKSRALAELTRTTLGESRSFRVVPSTQVGNILRRMRLPPDTAVDLDLARRIERRSGVKLIVHGRVARIRNTFVVTLRLFGRGAMGFATENKTVRSVDEIAGAVEELSRELSPEIAPALGRIRNEPAPPAVTTASDDALILYASGRAANDSGRPREGESFLRKAVALDAEFAEAWRLLGVILRNAGAPRRRSDSAFVQAFRLRDLENDGLRSTIVANYYMLGPGRDRQQAIDINERRLGRADSGRILHLAELLMSKQDFARAETLYAAVAARSPNVHYGYTHLVEVQINLGALEKARESATLALSKFPESRHTIHASAVLHYHEGYRTGQLDRLRTILDSLRASAEHLETRAWATAMLSRLELLHGRIASADTLFAAAQLYASSSDATFTETGDRTEFEHPSVVRAYFDQLRDRPERFAAQLEAALTQAAAAGYDVPFLQVARAYARSGHVMRARQVLERYELDVAADSARRRDEQPAVHEVNGLIALAEKRGRAAVEELRAVRRNDGPVDSCTNCRYDAISRAYTLMGQRDSAIANLRRYIETPSYQRILNFGLDPMLLAPSYEQLAALYDAGTDPESKQKALEAYRQFIALWETADPELQRRVQAAKSRVAELVERIRG